MPPPHDLVDFADKPEHIIHLMAHVERLEANKKKQREIDEQCKRHMETISSFDHDDIENKISYLQKYMENKDFQFDKKFYNSFFNKEAETIEEMLFQIFVNKEIGQASYQEAVEDIMHQIKLLIAREVSNLREEWENGWLFALFCCALDADFVEPDVMEKVNKLQKKYQQQEVNERIMRMNEEKDEKDGFSVYEYDEEEERQKEMKKRKNTTEININMKITEEDSKKLIDDCIDILKEDLDIP